MAGKVGASKDGFSEPNVIPFIDILLVLLIIFMVTAPIPTVDIRVDLPPPNPVPIRLEGLNPTFIIISETGAGMVIAVDSEVVQLSQLGQVTLDHARNNNPALDFNDVYAEARIFVRADQSTAYGNVVNVMSQLQEEGFAKVGIFSELAQSEG
ncbi:biopolymer transporter ExbD [Terricaulis silvestris]|jgi:biopolymer transport protein ExbD|uniref:Biopolymer transport protein ExbD n=1 Tax=Terricaulis silvestris TaxID=2686094 RepID=A0A6I6MQD2_9CAUL|nr:biopolymer transporter ExbD [Terricaulis silvestris]QGZ95618.1 Biopolymer transport protein ExbD [Terricaulis silvestris]